MVSTLSHIKTHFFLLTKACWPAPAELTRRNPFKSQLNKTFATARAHCCKGAQLHGIRHTHPPLSCIQLLRGPFKYSVIQSAMLSTCDVVPSLEAHSTHTVPPNSKKAIIRPQFTPSRNSSSITSANLLCAVAEVRCSCRDISVKSGWYSLSSSSPASRRTLWMSACGSDCGSRLQRWVLLSPSGPLLASRYRRTKVGGGSFIDPLLAASSSRTPSNPHAYPCLESLWQIYFSTILRLYSFAIPAQIWHFVYPVALLNEMHYDRICALYNGLHRLVQKLGLDSNRQCSELSHTEGRYFTRKLGKIPWRKLHRKGVLEVKTHWFRVSSSLHFQSLEGHWRPSLCIEIQYAEEVGSSVALFLCTSPRRGCVANKKKIIWMKAKVVRARRSCKDGQLF